ncbi:hypothetical protein [Mycobacterium kiyosense]
MVPTEAHLLSAHVATLLKSTNQMLIVKRLMMFYSDAMTMRTLIQLSKGKTSRQAHRDLPAADSNGELLKDDELTRHGFDGREAVLWL